MNRKTNQPSADPQPDTEQKLAFYRAQLENTDHWPEKVVVLLHQVSRKTHTPLTERDQEVLSLVIHDALQGLDIQKQYPAFYQRLVHESHLREAFLDILAMAQAETEPTLESASLPTPSFVPPPPQSPLLQRLADRWKITWHQNIAQLNALFLAPGLEPTYRGEANLEDPWFVLVRDQVNLDETQFLVFLEAAQQGEKPDELQLAMNVSLHGLTPLNPPPLSAHLHWGTYAESMTITQGRATFPPVPLFDILNDSMTAFQADLYLTLELAK